MKTIFPQVGARTLNDLSEELRAACYTAQIDADVVAKSIVDTLHNLNAVHGSEHAKAIAKMGGEMLRQALEHKKSPTIFAFELKKIAGWLGMIQMGWL